MANLSNINNKFLFTDGDFLKIGNLAPINNISGTESGLSITNSNVASIALDNTAANGKTYVMYSDDGGKLNFYDVDASSGRLVIDSSGNVGIGDASPDSTLSLQNSQSTAANNTTTGSIFQALSPNSGIFMRNRGASAGIGGSSYSTQLFTDSGAGNFEIYNISSTFSLVFGTNATERMRIDSSGVVDITGGILDMGQNRIDGSSDNLKISADNSSVSGSSTIEFLVDADEKMRINNSGNVGIGTASPNFKLDIVNAAANTATYQQFRNGTTGAASSDGTVLGIDADGDFLINNQEAKEIKLYTSDTPRLIIQSGGNVGIGTASPKTNLEVIGGLNISTNTTSATTTTMRIGSYGASSQTYYGAKIVAHTDFTSTANTDLSFDLGGLGEVMRLHSIGSEKRVGIGTTSPNTKLDVVTSGTSENVIQLRNATQTLALGVNNNSGGAFLFTNTNHALRFGCNGSEVGRFSNIGNLGIGITNPLQKLQVGGNIRVGDTAGSGRPYIDFVRNGGAVVGGIGWHTDDVFYVAGHPSLGPGAGNDVRVWGFGQDLRLGTNTAGDRITIVNTGNVGIGLTNPSQKLEVTGNFKLNGTLVQEGTGNNITYKYRTANSNLHSGGNALCKFGRFYWTPGHWVTGAPVIKVTLHCKYYQGEKREYIIKAGYQNTDPIINELQPSSTQQKITLQVGATTSAGYNYAGQPVYYVDLQWVQTAYIWGWAQVESQVGFLTSNPTSSWGGVVMDSTISQNNNAGTPTNYTSFFAGNIKVPSTYSLTTGTAANMHVDSNGIFYRSTSSLKYKKEVRNYDKGLNEVMQLQPKYYKGEDDGDIQFAGLIAEDVHDLGLTEFVQYADDGSPDALSYSHMIALLTKSIQELKAEIDELKK
jgi:hypothetical protein